MDRDANREALAELTSLSRQNVDDIHRVRVQKGRFEYWVNDKLVFSDLMPDMPIKKVGIRVCGRQTVAFDHLMVKSINGDRQK